MPAKPARLLLLPLLLASLAACATKPPPSDPEDLAAYHQENDPLEPTNRFFYWVDDGLDTYVLRPVAVAYRHVPEAVRTPVHNVLSNIGTPIIFADDVMQARSQRAGTSMMRFLINTTAGAGGLFDVAARLGYPGHASDFGVTLALWGVGPGPFLFLPVLGPSDPRDATGYGVDVALDPFTWTTFGGSKTLEYSKYALGTVDARERVLDVTDNVKKTALDPYATFRSLYRQNRQYQIDQTRADDKHTTPAWFSAPPAQ